MRIERNDTMIDKEQKCSEMVAPPGLWGAFHQHRCKRKATVVRDGKPYCKVHDPEYKQAKSDKAYAEYEERKNRERAQFELSRTAVTACKEINPNNPIAVAESIVECFECLKAIRHFQGIHNIITDERIDNLFDKIEGNK